MSGTEVRFTPAALAATVGLVTASRAGLPLDLELLLGDVDRDEVILALTILARLLMTNCLDRGDADAALRRIGTQAVARATGCG